MTIANDSLHRGVALQFLLGNRQKMSFQVAASINEMSLNEFRKRGCDVQFEQAQQLYTISAAVPFEKLVTPEELSQHRWAPVLGFGVFVLIKGGTLVVLFAAVKLHVGLLTAVLWAWGWFFFASTVFPKQKSRRRFALAALGVGLFTAGVIAYQLGWSVNR